MMTLSDACGQRLSRVLELMKRINVNVLVVSSPANVMYLTGYWTILSPLSPQALIIDRDRVILIIPALEASAAEELNLPWLEIIGYRNYPLKFADRQELIRSFLQTLSHVIETAKGKPIGTELDILTYPVHELLTDFANQVQDIAPGLKQLRAEKDQYEVASITASAEIAAAALLETRKRVRAGVTENELAAVIAEHVWTEGARATHIVVGSGPRSGLIHPLPTDRRLGAGDLVLIDIGIIFEGYWAEIARTSVVGLPTPEQIKWQSVVREAQDLSANGLRAGALASKVDALARDYIASSGFDATHFNHASGHGVGLLGMDPPIIAPGSEDQIPNSCGLTLEPALYFKGRGGVRIEDTYIVAGDKSKQLTSLVPKDLSN
jgi:Xaa-Pro aminopeptidase